jgi:hypothetical protein
MCGLFVYYCALFSYELREESFLFATIQGVKFVE